VFGENPIRLKTLDFQNKMHSVCESDDKIGFVEMGYTVVFVRDSEAEMIVSDIALYNLRLLQPKFGCPFPSVGIQHYLIYMTPLCFGAGTRCEKVNIRRCADGSIAVQDGKKWDFTLRLIGLDRRHESFHDTRNVFFLTEFTRITPSEIYLVSDISINEPKDLWKEAVSREQPELWVAIWVWCGLTITD